MTIFPQTLYQCVFPIYGKTLEKTRFFQDEDLLLPVVHINNLITAKKAAGRNKDLNDLEFLIPEE